MNDDFGLIKLLVYTVCMFPWHFSRFLDRSRVLALITRGTVIILLSITVSLEHIDA